jgi:hypothetical protein
MVMVMVLLVHNLCVTGAATTVLSGALAVSGHAGVVVGSSNGAMMLWGSHGFSTAWATTVRKASGATQKGYVFLTPPPPPPPPHTHIHTLSHSLSYVRTKAHAHTISADYHIPCCIHTRFFSICCQRTVGFTHTILVVLLLVRVLELVLVFVLVLVLVPVRVLVLVVFGGGRQ